MDPTPDTADQPDRTEPVRTRPPGTRPPGTRPAPDPLAAALGNASLLGVGYLLLRRRRLAVGSLAVTAVLVDQLASGTGTGWLRAATLLWWAAVTAHGWRLAARARRDAAGGRPGGGLTQLLVGLAAASCVLLTLVSLRIEAASLEREAVDAHRDGDCATAVSLLDDLWSGHRMVDPALVARAQDSIAACELLLRAEQQAEDDRPRAAETLEAYEDHSAALWEGAPGRRAEWVLAEAGDAFDQAAESGDTAAAATGFDHLAAVLAEFPGRRDEVEDVMNGFLDALDLADPCDARDLADWLQQRPARGDVLDRAADVVPRVEPVAIVGCADEAMADDDWSLARARYRQLLDEYPDHRLADQATDGAERAELALQLDTLRDLLAPGSGSSGDRPAYCDDPAPYRGADPYRGGGPHPALVYGEPDDHEDPLPDSWLAADPADAVVVLCVGDRERGSAVETCTYEYGSNSDRQRNVTFHNERYPVRVYEVRTGELVDTTTLEVSGSSCPYLLSYYGDAPPANDYVDPSASDVRDAYRPLLDP